MADSVNFNYGVPSGDLISRIGESPTGAALQTLGRAIGFGIIGGTEAALKYGIYEVLNIIDSQTPFNIGAKDFSPFGSILYWENIYQTVKNTNQQLGISGSLARDIENVSLETYKDIVAIGGEINDITDAYSRYVELSSINRRLTADELFQLAEIRAALGEGFEEIFVNLSLYGSSIKNIANLLDSVYVDTIEYGINAKSVLKGIVQNIDLLDKYNFEDGIKGLSKLVQISERFKINIQSATGFLDQALDLNNLIDTTAQLQVLGGEFATLADPFQLFYQARNNPEQIIENITELAAAYATLDENLGRFTITPYALDQIREFARITGMSVEEISKAAKISATLDAIDQDLSFSIKNMENYEQVLSRIGTSAFFNKDTNEWGVNITMGDGSEVFKPIYQLDEEDVARLEAISEGVSQEDVYTDLISTNETLIESIERLINVFKRQVISDTLYRLSDAEIKTLVQDVKLTIGGNRDVQSFGELLDRLDEGMFNNMMANIDRLGAVIPNAGGFLEEHTDQIMSFIQQGNKFFTTMNQFWFSLFQRGAPANVSLGENIGDAMRPSGFSVGKWLFGDNAVLTDEGKVDLFPSIWKGIVGKDDEKANQDRINQNNTVPNNGTGLLSPQSNINMDFGELNGQIELMLNGQGIDNLEASEIFEGLSEEIKGRMKDEIKKMIYKEIRENTIGNFYKTEER